MLLLGPCQLEQSSLGLEGQFAFKLPDINLSQ